MARKRDMQTYVEKPRPDVYLAIMILTFVATLVATVLMYFEYSSL